MGMGGQIAAGNEEVDEKEAEVGDCVESGIKEVKDLHGLCDADIYINILLCVFN